MKRIYAERAYSDDRIDRCYWAQGTPNAALGTPQASGEITTEVAIIGGGFTGLSAALHLAEAGINAIVLEARFPMWGASGRNGGFCCLGGSAASNIALVKRFGADSVAAYRKVELGAIDLVAGLLERHKIDADTHSNGETQLAHRPSRFAELERAALAAEEQYGITPELIPRQDLGQHGLNGPFHGALTLPAGFGLNPRKYGAGLLRAAQDAGANVYSHSPVQKIDLTNTGYTLHTTNARAHCKRLIIATNGYSSEDTPAWMAARYLPTQSSVIVTRPLSDAELAAQGWTSNQMSYDTRNLLHYFRLMPDRRFLFGMRGGLSVSKRAWQANQRAIRRDFERMFPAWVAVETPHYWSGMVCLSAGLVPYCGPIPEMPEAFAGFAYHGNGVAMGSYCGALLADLALGRPPERPYSSVMATPPNKFPLGPLRRALKWPAYGAAYLQDMF